LVSCGEVVFIDVCQNQKGIKQLCSYLTNHLLNSMKCSVRSRIDSIRESHITQTITDSRVTPHLLGAGEKRSSSKCAAADMLIQEPLRKNYSSPRDRQRTSGDRLDRP